MAIRSNLQMMTDLKRELSKYTETIQQLDSTIQETLEAVGDVDWSTEIQDFQEYYARDRERIERLEKTLNKITQETLPHVIHLYIA